MTLNDGDVFNNDTETLCEEITYTRNFSNTKWQALYVPFEMSYNDWSADFEVARLNDVHQWDDDEDGLINRQNTHLYYSHICKNRLCPLGRSRFFVVVDSILTQKYRKGNAWLSRFPCVRFVIDMYCFLLVIPKIR